MGIGDKLRGVTGKHRGQQVVAVSGEHTGKSGTVQDGFYNDSNGNTVAPVRDSNGNTFDANIDDLKDIHSGR